MRPRMFDAEPAGRTQMFEAGACGRTRAAGSAGVRGRTQAAGPTPNEGELVMYVQPVYRYPGWIFDPSA